MKVHFLRRLIRVLLTVIGVTFLVFTVSRILPGSPIQRKIQAAADDDQGWSGERFSDARLDELERTFGYEQSIFTAYFQWIGVQKRKTAYSEAFFSADSEDEVILTLRKDGRKVRVLKSEHAVEFLNGDDALKQGWGLTIETPKDQQHTWQRRNPGKTTKDAPERENYRAIVFQKKYSGLLQGDWGYSRELSAPVGSLIRSRLPVMLYFLALTALVVYGFSIPLGLLKAVRHHRALDRLTSLLVFLGYSVPGFAVGTVLLVYLAGGDHWFELRGLKSPGFEAMPLPEKLRDLAVHSALPLACYVAGSFAWLTMKIKNGLLDELSSDYIRTALAKGASVKRVVFLHAFRNSWVPIAASLGQFISLIIASSIFIEAIFEIQGLGILQYYGILEGDQMLILGTLTMISLLMVVGNALSDLVVAAVNPRIKSL